MIYLPFLVCFGGSYFSIFSFSSSSVLTYSIGFYWCQLFFHSFIFVCLILLFFCCYCFVVVEVFAVLDDSEFVCSSLCFTYYLWFCVCALSVLTCPYFYGIYVVVLLLIIICHFFCYVIIGGFWYFFWCFCLLLCLWCWCFRFCFWYLRCFWFLCCCIWFLVILFHSFHLFCCVLCFCWFLCVSLGVIILLLSCTIREHTSYQKIHPILKEYIENNRKATQFHEWWARACYPPNTGREHHAILL